MNPADWSFDVLLNGGAALKEDQGGGDEGPSNQLGVPIVMVVSTGS